MEIKRLTIYCKTKIFALLTTLAIVSFLLYFIPKNPIPSQYPEIINPSTTQALNSELKQWDIIYDQHKLASTIKLKHDLRYNVPTDEKCVKRRPQCIVIGVTKCGTTELVDFMGLHPNIVIRGQHETTFNPLNKKSVDRLIQEMPCSFHDQITVFKNSFFLHEMQPEYLHKYNKNLKMIVLVREPVSRLISLKQFTFFSSNKYEQWRQLNVSSMPSIDDALINPKTGLVTKFSMQSVYDEPLSRYLKYFTRDNLLIIESRELVNNPAHVLFKVETFLGLKHIIDERDFVYNEQKRFYCIRSDHEQMVCYGTNRGRTEFKEIRNETRAKLKTFYKQHNENFFKLIGTRYDW